MRHLPGPVLAEANRQLTLSTIYAIYMSLAVLMAYTLIDDQIYQL